MPDVARGSLSASSISGVQALDADSMSPVVNPSCQAIQKRQQLDNLTEEVGSIRRQPNGQARRALACELIALHRVLVSREEPRRMTAIS
jgi:hypothetical protein